MDHDEFIWRVQERAGLPSTEEAERATRATLVVLGEYLTGYEGPALADRLPQGIAEHLKRQPPDRVREFFSLDDFVQRVAEEEEASLGEAHTHARAVMSALGEAVPPDDMEDVRLQFPSGFDSLFEEQNG